MSGRIRGLTAALPLALTLVLTGCSSGDDSGKVASANSGSKDGGSKDGGSSKPSLSTDEMALKFVQCLRKQGLDVEDPKPGGGIGIKADPQHPMSKEQVDKATAACRKYEPQGQGPRAKDPKAAEKMREYSQCMRKNGVEDFPDPKPGGGIQIEGPLMDDPDFKKAEKKCNHFMGGGGQLHSEQD
ncbi:hypothetical protein ACQEVG_09955 [Streptomyces sp. CA-135486]|uniref:hypothetical protein n=1 Tax=Streptomyces sp. CA-135486 TaxID=3240049 RepID=UPI003D8A1953